MSRLRTHVGAALPQGNYGRVSYGHILCNPPRYAFNQGYATLGVDYVDQLPREKWECIDDLETDGAPFTQEHDLRLIKKYSDPFRAHGALTTGQRGQNPCKFYDWYVNGFTNYAFASVDNFTGPPLGDMNDLTLQAMAHSNPYAADLDLPLFLFELREFPQLLKHYGDLLFRRVKEPSEALGDANLAFQFGWKPFIQDLAKMLELQQKLDNQLGYLASLASGRNIKRQLSDAEWNGQEWTIPIFQGDPNWEPFAVVRARDIVKRKVWYSFRCKDPSALPVLPTTRSQIAHLLGLSRENFLSASTLWNTVPWTWLIDWFSSFGDFIEATQGAWAYNVADFCVMCHTTLRQEVLIADTNLSQPITGKGWSGTAKQRKVSHLPPLPRLSIPILSARQVGILTSLATSGKIRSYSGGGLT